MIALATAGCDVVAVPRATPVPSPTPVASAGPSDSPVDPRSIYERVELQVAALRGLRPKRPVTRTTIDEVALRAILAEVSEREQPAAQIAATERLYRGLGLIGPEDSLAQISQNLQGDQIAGFYRTDTQELYVVSRSRAGGVGVLEKVVFAHEFTHALQDQHYPLDLLTADEASEGDRVLSRMALIEGDATLLMTLWAQAHLGVEELLALVGLSLGPSQASLEDVPVFLRESLLFPYQAGLQFAMGIHVQGGWEAVNAAFEDPPESTEQVLHPEKYAGRERPVEVELPADLAARMGVGWTQTIDDTFGEHQIGSWLRARGAKDASVAAAGWGGDRMALLDGPDGQWAILFETAWDTIADAEEFAAAIRQVIDPAVQAGDGRRVILVLASDEGTRSRLADALG